MGTDLKMKVSASLIAIANAGTIDLFGAQRTTEMNTPDAPFCINCSDATLGQFPWQLSLQTTGHFCGGSILSATALSTAAHCRKSKLILSLVIHNTTVLRLLMISLLERSALHLL